MSLSIEHPNVQQLTQALADFFDPSEVKFKPAVVSGNRAMAIAYVDARVIQDRLDDVLGVEGWSDDYECRDDGSVICRLRLRLGNEWITKVDVGSPSEQPDGGDRLKAAFSDALKRAAVKFGIGRYLYRLPSQWVDYDPAKRQFIRTPTLPGWAQPGRAPTTPLTPARPATPATPATPAAPAPAGKPAGHALPASGVEFQRRLQDYDAKLAKAGVIAAGDLVRRVVQAGVLAGHGPDLTTWSQAGMTLAAEETKTFEAQARQRKAVA